MASGYYPGLFPVFSLIALFLGLYSLNSGQYQLDTAIWFAFSYFLYKA